MPHEYRNQPVKGIYLTYQLLTTALVRAPIWVLLSIPRSWRPRPSWSMKMALRVELIKHLFRVLRKVGQIKTRPTHLAIVEGVGINGVWVEPASRDLVTGKLGIWSSISDVGPIRLPGYWINREGFDIPIGQAPAPGEKVAYCLHGGAYISLSAHPSDRMATIARGLVKHVASVERAFSIEYRLSSAAPYEAKHPFPTALLDALSGYNYLVNMVGFAPSDIIIEGDSAGGNLALALTRYLVEYQNNNIGIPPPPGALVLLSPWCDLSLSHKDPDSSVYFKSDYLGGDKSKTPYAPTAFLGPHGFGAAEFSEYISPASPKAQASFVGFPRTFIAVGGAEILRDECRELRDGMKRDIGSDLTYYELEDAVHDYIPFGWEEEEEDGTLRAIGKWIAMQ